MRRALVSHIGSGVSDEIAFPLMLERMKKRTAYPENGCWHSNAHTNGSGYCQITFRGERIYQHRLSYIIHHGPIPAGLEAIGDSNPPGMATVIGRAIMRVTQ